jgi:hypothetical protein
LTAFGGARDLDAPLPAALRNAASIAAMVLTTETLITDIPEKAAAGAAGGHGHGGGGDMDF